MASNENVERSLMKTFSLDGNFIFSNKSDSFPKYESFTEKSLVDAERYGNLKHNRIFSNPSNERHKVPIDTLERERSERSQDLEEAWIRVKRDVLDGREDASMQTEDFIPSDKTFTKDAVSQTDAFAEGHVLVTDALDTAEEGTQLSKGELLDFDTEVEPILEELVAPIIEEALLEVMEEEQQLAGNLGRSQVKDKPTNSITNAELRSAWSSFQEEMNEELMISVLANNYVDDVLSSVYGFQSNYCHEETAIKDKNRDYVQNFLPWFVAEIDYELEMLQEVYEKLKIDCDDVIHIPETE